MEFPQKSERGNYSIEFLAEMINNCNKFILTEGLCHSATESENCLETVALKIFFDREKDKKDITINPSQEHHLSEKINPGKTV